MIKHWSFYDPRSGHFSGRTFSATDDSALELNTPDGLAAIEGEHDHLCRRVDITTGDVIDYQPPAPSADHEWNAAAKRWQPTAQAKASDERKTAARIRIAYLETNVQPRAIREAQLNRPGSMKRLQEIDDEIVALRKALTE